MNRLILIEVRKLVTTPAALVTLAVVLFFTVLPVVTGVLLAGQNGAAPVGTPENVSKTLSIGAATSMAMLVLGILIAAAEYRHRTIAATYLAEPRRWRVLVAKLLVAAGVGAVLGAVMFGIGLAVALPLFASKGIHHLPSLGAMFVGAVLSTACYGLLGVALGALTRNTVVAVIGALIWVQAIEVGVLQGAVPALAKWLPTGAAVAITSVDGTTDGLLSPGVGAVVLVAWAAVLAAVAARFSLRRDVR